MPRGTAPSTVNRIRTWAEFGLASGTIACLAANGKASLAFGDRLAPDSRMSTGLPRTAARGVIPETLGGAAGSEAIKPNNHTAGASSQTETARRNIRLAPRGLRNLTGQFPPGHGPGDLCPLLY